ncbi:MAG: hydroxymethylglutaryl-CoA lyase [Chlorobi bacterium]|nr:hydroxymethylglutaryl-CoA lyase [Chlorobiota bacterium]
MQGIKWFIPTEDKVRYIRALLDVGFDTVDFGSFVSPKAIPQMRDTARVVEQLDLSHTSSKLLAIIANLRGARDAVRFPQIAYLGYPFSVSEIFQMRNTAKTIAESVDLLKEILDLAAAHGKETVVYLSMGFGNPYGEPWSPEIVAGWVEKLYGMGVRIMSLSDTIGAAVPETVDYLFRHLIPLYPDVEFGAHLHTHPENWYEKIDAAYRAGCRRFDSAIRGFGGCPMAKDELTGNLPTEKLLNYFQQHRIPTGLDMKAFERAYNEALRVFSPPQEKNIFREV